MVAVSSWSPRIRSSNYHDNKTYLLDRLRLAFEFTTPILSRPLIEKWRQWPRDS